ncbi:DUF1934 domain-containing protein [Oceanobacillus saliphilus]|uniref:DUF1934 domain-containing protein n=1 Tax=Oceanobacillus saliphilus TaxID=2925834 RepID=UPI00201D7C14|nr:DUF1934 domain-containing protein [Oceanobacillus saliphilus]
MDSFQKKVKIKLKTMIDDGSQKEYNNQMQSGNYFRKKDLDVLIFDEKMDDGSIVKNLITIQKHKVSINRSGAVSMNQKFLAGQITENVYHHAHGKIHMETFTENIGYSKSIDSIEGHMTINYTVKLNGQDKRQHTLKLIYIEEDVQ